MSRTRIVQTTGSADALEFTYGVVSRQVYCSFLLAKPKVAKPKTGAPSATRSKSTLRKPKEKKVVKPKVKTPNKPKTTVTKKSITKTLRKQTAHIRRAIEHGVVNKSDGASRCFKGANTCLRQILCNWNQNRISNAILERGCG